MLQQTHSFMPCLCLCLPVDPLAIHLTSQPIRGQTRKSLGFAPRTVFKGASPNTNPPHMVLIMTVPELVRAVGLCLSFDLTGFMSAHLVCGWSSGSRGAVLGVQLDPCLHICEVPMIRHGSDASPPSQLLSALGLFAAIRKCHSVMAASNLLLLA
jgi:hypothetical protein